VNQNHGSIPAALISTDAAFRETLTEQLAVGESGFHLAVEIAAPFIEIGNQQLQQLREVQPQLVFVDLERDAEVGIKLAQFLAEQQPSRQFVAVGPVLAPELLMQAMRAGITEYLPKPVTAEALAPALARMQRKLGVAAGGPAREPGKVMSFFSAKGGSGATTVATNLAIHLHQLTGKRVLLVDMDLELGEIALFLGMQPRFNLVDLVRNFHRMDAELLASYIEQHKSGVHLLSAPYSPEKVESVNGEQIRAILHFLKQHYDYVVVDTPKTFTPATLAAFEQADEIYLVSNVDLPSLRNIKRCLPLLDRLTGGHMEEKLRLVVNRHNSSANEISLDEVERTLGLKIYWKLGNDYETVIRAINTGEPLILDGKGSTFAKDLKALGAELTGLGAVTNGKRSGLLGFRRIFGGAKEVAHE
jgi:pilus assembly protein CpaE